ncbi:catechol 1,2-dioxygenase [Roseibium sp. CAU 1637]|uniref:Catechol 1,2-dioxygenase n=1 Tax=Roseibium limicola TaxID=2816037 RepID=A0A939ENP5_9HYPH|nr:dioxygenase [Roseibium limicola]MBO0344329.1 catechol 1,2-dioxygenase [Roseibium limicola]
MNTRVPPQRLIATEDDVTPMVLAAMDQTTDPRFKEIITSLVRHLHAFIQEVRPTEEEYERGLQILNAIGQQTDDTHNEAVLICDVLGASTLIDLINNDGMQGETMSALLGPFYRGNAPHCGHGESIARSSTSGDPLILKGRVLDVNGAPIAGAKLDVWQASPDGLYENQDREQDDFNLRGLFTTNKDGEYLIRTTKPAGYPVPVHTTTGDLLRAQNRTPMRPAHVHFIVSAPEHKTLVTQIFSDTDEAMISDVVFGAKEQIAGDLQRHDTPMADYPDQVPPFYTCTYDFILKPGVPTFPEPPIKGKVS